MSPSGARGMGF